jgi:imidazoleglycerol-phosphate dehydratase
MRTATIRRETRETTIDASFTLDGRGQAAVETPMPFLSHMIEQLARHGLFDVRVVATGDVEIDGHHTTEDLGFVLGQCVDQALGDRSGIRRFGWSLLPMDEARVACTLDLCGRPHFVWEVPMPKTKIGSFDTELAEVFFEAFARGARCNLHVKLERGEILHHIVEVSFKALAKALEAATRVDPRVDSVPSTKGTLTS